MKEQRGKKLAVKFILNESSVTYRPPSGYYRDFGVRDHKGLGGRSPEIIELNEDDDNEMDDMIVDDLPKRKVVLKKPKAGFIENEIISDENDDFNINSDVINRNVQKAIDSLNAEDLDVEKIMEYDEGSSDENRDVSAKKTYRDVSDENSGGMAGDDHDVNGCNVERSPVKVN